MSSLIIDFDVKRNSLRYWYAVGINVPLDGKNLIKDFIVGADGWSQWFIGNVWDSSLVNLIEVPADGIYKFESTVAVAGDMVDVSTFGVGFRCDNWASGSFRVRNVKIEKGDHATAWSPGI